MSLTNFQKVIQFSNTAEIPHFTKPQTTITNTSPKVVEYRMSLIREEVEELEDAVKTHNFPEIIDALSDILYVVYGMGSTCGIDLDKTFNEVHESNMSKFCKTEEEAKDTVEWYKKNEKRYDSPSYRKSKHGDVWIVYNESTLKILKSIKYTPVNFIDGLS